MKSLKLVLLALIVASSNHLIAQHQKDGINSTVYVCPPCNSSCDTLAFLEAGTCSHCGMSLITKEEMEAKNKKITIAFYLQPRVEILDFAGPLEVFSYADFDVFIVSKTKAPIKAQGILTVIPDYSIDDAPQADILAFFGGNAREAYEDTDVINWVKSQQVDYHFSVCTGAFILAESSLLKNQTATTFHNALDGLEKHYPETKVVRNARFVDNGKVITTAGISAGIDGALHLVAKLKGFNQAREVAYYMEYDKWVPAEGLILTEQHPYDILLHVNELKSLVGKYEYSDGEEVIIEFDMREKSLYAWVNEQAYPLFYEGENLFSNLKGEKVRFVLNESGEVSGYKIGQEAKLYKFIGR